MVISIINKMKIPKGKFKMNSNHSINTVIFFFFIIFTNANAQQDAMGLINAVNEKFKSVKDYTASVQIKTDIPFVKMLPVNATVYFKQPDKIHMESKGISILPKQGPQFFMNEINAKNDIAIFVADEVIDGVTTKGIKVFPIQDTADLILATLYFEPNKLLLYKAQVTTKSRGTVNMSFKYGSYSNFQLPDVLTFEMDVNKFKIPKAVAADLENTTTKKDDGKKTKKGTVVITYKSYKVNSGLSDAIFKNK